jgi:hypothetical protein
MAMLKSNMVYIYIYNKFKKQKRIYCYYYVYIYIIIYYISPHCWGSIWGLPLDTLNSPCNSP